ncbi:MAG TPA: alpha-amylase domain-containing protein [Nitrospirota bacterium]|nr:alpha-amylase domain-containing protein [Nitrospirota bacterium]
MGVIMQAFYWDCPKAENKENQWWPVVEQSIPALRVAGFTALWLPPASKGANLNGPSMGYDPYDYYDLGDIDQKGSVKTWFGSRGDLDRLIKEAHASGMDVYADVVFNHNSGADAQETNPLDNSNRWTKFTPKSGKFPRDYTCFHPSPYEQWDNGVFGDMPDLCHRNPYVYSQLIEYARWLLEEVGFDGFRYDCVKGYGGWMARAIQELRALKNGKPMKPFGVGECWDSERVIDDWLDETNAWSDSPVAAFDFPLRDRLKSLCDTHDYDLRGLMQPGALFRDRPADAVTFVENHDIVRDNPIVNDKMLAYAFILTHEGYPCVFWQDYFTWGLGQPGLKSGIAALVQVHEEYAAGATTILYCDRDLYIMQRDGWAGRHGLILVINNRGDCWNGTWVQSKWPDTAFTTGAWCGLNDAGIPQEKYSQTDGWCDFWAPPRGYAVYLPQLG